jgi:hypothetical protein
MACSGTALPFYNRTHITSAADNVKEYILSAVIRITADVLRKAAEKAEKVTLLRWTPCGVAGKTNVSGKHTVSIFSPEFSNGE